MKCKLTSELNLPGYLEVLCSLKYLAFALQESEAGQMMAPDDLAKEEEELRQQREHGAKKSVKARLCCSSFTALLKSASCMEA